MTKILKINPPSLIVKYLQTNGFIIPNAEIYGGFGKHWDLGYYGAEIKKKIKDLWWRFFVETSPFNIGCDTTIITSPRVLEASGHLKNFFDWSINCLSCYARYRIDNLLTAEQLEEFNKTSEKISFSFNEYKIKCFKCKSCNFSKPYQFNLLMTTNLGYTASENNLAYLRPETCQGIFVNFLSLQKSTHRKLPFGIGQVGKSFRNEMVLKHGIFRTREFEQLELEFFCSKQEKSYWWSYWIEKVLLFIKKLIVNDPSKVHEKNIPLAELPHYAATTLDFYFDFSFGSNEICSNSDRGDFDLKQHIKFSKGKLKINGDVPYVIESSIGLERIMLAVLEDSFHQEELIQRDKKTIRTVLKLFPLLSPYFVAIIPLYKIWRIKALEVYHNLLTENFNSVYEESSSIGKSYRKQDAIGTYYCITIDRESLDNESVTLRNRDSMKQERISISILSIWLRDKFYEFNKLFLIGNN